MSSASLFTELSLVVVIGAGIAALMQRMRQPLILGHILTGIIVGPAILDVVHTESAFGVFGTIGVALLLFIIGLELSLKVFSKLGKVVFSTAAAEVISITLLGALASNLLLDLSLAGNLIVGLSLSLSSTIIIVKILGDKRETARLYAQIAIGVLIVQDVVATLGKILVAAQSGESQTFLSILFLILRGVLVTGGMFWAGKNLLPKLKAQIEGSRELMLLSGLAWGLGFAVLFEKVGFSVEIGALLAGMSIAGLPFSGEIGVRLKPLRDFFIVIFFVSLGYGMDVGKIPGVMVPAVILSLIVVLVKPFVVMANMGMSGYTKKASFKASVALAQVSEFSLVFMLSAFGAGLVTERAINTLTVVALITFLSSTYMMKYDDELFSLLENKLRVFERRVTNQEQKHLQNNYPIVMFGYRKGGSEFVKTFEKMGKKFVVVDYDPEVVELIDRKGLNLIYGDAVDAEVMEEVGLENSKLIVSNIHDLHTNALLLSWLEGRNPKAVFICSADSAEEAIELYAKGAAYVVMPHMVGSEKMGSFLQKNNLSKAEFKRSRERHLRQIEKYYAELKEDDDSSGLNP